MKKVVLLFVCLLTFSGCQKQENTKILVSDDTQKVILVDKSEYKEITALTNRLEFDDNIYRHYQSKCKKLFINENGITYCYRIYNDGTIEWNMNEYKKRKTFNVEIATKLSLMIDQICLK